LEKDETLVSVTRIEVIDWRTSKKCNWTGHVLRSGIDEDMVVMIQYQDDGRTLKIFLMDKVEE
jgi:hypothetical protein